MEIQDLLSRIALSFGIGLLLGLERGWSAREGKAGSRAAGVRTFAITGLLGGIVGALAYGEEGLTVAGGILLGVAFAAFGAVITSFSRDENKGAGRHSATNAVAAMLTFILGAYSVLGEVAVAAASAVAAAGVLALRDGLHGWIEKITRQELESGLALLAMTFIALPVVPDRAVGPFGGVNLRDVWLIAIVLAAVSFAAYISVRYFGEKRGIVISALIGGLVSSTAVALSSARRAATGEGAPATQAAATALATAVSFIRVIVLAGALQPSLVLPIAPALIVAALGAVGFAVLALSRAREKNGSKATVAFRNPFGFWSVILLAATMGVLIVVGRFIADQFGAQGTLLGAALMGLFDVDATTVAMARLVPESLAVKGAALAILAGAATNTITKVVIAASIGRGRFAVDIAAVAAACLIGGGLALAGTLALTDI